jgi:hypothetical protein
MPTKTKPQSDDLVVALYSFAGHDVSVSEGAPFRADSEIVTKFADRFVPASTPDAELHRLRAAANAPPPAPEPLGRLKLRVLPGQGGSLLDGGTDQQVFADGRTYHSGEFLEAEGAGAQHLLDSGAVEVVRKLRSRAEETTGFTTGRSEDD